MKFFPLIIVLYLSALFSLMPTIVENRLTLIVSGLKCVAIDQLYLEFPLCEIKAITRDTFEASVRTTLLKKPVENVMIYTKLFKRGYEHLSPLYSFDIDGCVFLNSKRRNPLAMIVYKIIGLECCSNINHSCPYDHDIILENYRWNSSTLPMLPIPTGRYVLHVKWFTYKKYRALVSIFFQLIDK